MTFLRQPDLDRTQGPRRPLGRTISEERSRGRHWFPMASGGDARSPAPPGGNFLHQCSWALYGRGALRACALGVFWPAPTRCQRTPGHTEYHGVSGAVTAVAGTTPSHPTSPSPTRLTKARTFPAPFAPVICVALLMLLPRYLWTDPFPNSCNISAGRKRARGASGTCCSFLWI